MLGRAVGGGAHSGRDRGQELRQRIVHARDALVVAYIGPWPFTVSVAGALLFAVVLLLTKALGRATGGCSAPPSRWRVEPGDLGGVVSLMVFGCLRARHHDRRYYSRVSGERVMASLRTRVSDRYRDLALQFHRETPTGELLAHMEADVKAAVDVFWPVPFAIGHRLVVLALVPWDDVWIASSAVLFHARLMNRASPADGPPLAQEASARSRRWRTSRSTARSS
jgi:hypothetical protein